jgi:glycosyltransferase involved in cell wall biosynthesis
VRIAQIAPLFESVPPRLYGGTERVVSYLTEELVRLGHDVTLFASGDSATSARLLPGFPRSLRLAGRVGDEASIHLAMLKQVYALRHQFDVVHLHIDDWHLRDASLFDLVHLTTVHGRLDLDERLQTFAPYRNDLALTSISEAQRAPLGRANWMGTVHHGLPPDLCQPSYEPGHYLVFLGRVSPEKRVDRAIDIAGAFGMRLKIAAKVDDFDREYHASIRHKFESPWVDFVGEVNETEKNELLRHAYALLFPIDWPEPFGLAMIEAMSCGTPVVAWSHGSIPEIVDDGLTGFIVDSEEGAVRALGQIPKLDRRRVAKIARQRFGVRRMALDYIRLYERCLRAREELPMLRVSSGGVVHAGTRK